MFKGSSYYFRVYVLFPALLLSVICPGLFSGTTGDSSHNVFIYAPQAGEVYRYSIETQTDNIDKSPANDYANEKTFEKRVIHYTKTVKNIEKNGDIIFELKIDSISGEDGSASNFFRFSYNRSNCYSNNPANIDTNDYLGYFVLIEEPFNLRVRKNGEVLEAYGLQKIQSNLISLYADTLNEAEKEEIKRSISSSAISEIFQDEYLMLPERGIDDNTKVWTRKVRSEIVYWETENSIEHAVKDRNSKEIVIESKLKAKIPKKDVIEDNGFKISVASYSFEATGETLLDMLKQCVKQRSIRSNTQLKMDLSNESESGYYLQKKNYSIVVKLLN